MKKLLVFFISIIFLSCSDSSSMEEIETIDYGPINETEIQAYLSDNNLAAEKTASGLYYIIHNEGTGASPTSQSNVTVNYKGYFLNGDVFDQNENIDFILSQLIPGFNEGVQLLKEGGAGTFIIPSRLAYRNQGIGIIPPGAVIIFDIDLLKIN